MTADTAPAGSAGTDQDDAVRVLETVHRARAEGQRLRIQGAGSKGFLSPSTADVATVSVGAHRGLISYRPEELVVTVRAGTPINVLESALAEAGQYLPFEPPRFGGAGTVGGLVATGLSGPGRPWAGSVRDAILGVEMINGLGERLRFGGQVMKNVAGFDLSRLQAGAFGTLGILLSVSFKVLPCPVDEQTRVFDCDQQEAQRRMRHWARLPLPLSAACHHGERLRVRLSGAPAALAEAGRLLGGAIDTAGAEFWSDLRDGRLRDCLEPGLWRVTVPPAALLPPALCVNWGGAERWYRVTNADEARVLGAAACAAGGSARPFDADYAVYGDPMLERYSARLRRAFDPDGLFNPHIFGSDREQDDAH
jgi:glycolate oxidase FAD binding subunit